MKGSQDFESAIKTHLDAEAEKDPLFAQAYAKEGKSIADCCTYIMNEVQKMGVNGLADQEVYGLAKHYYDEDNLTVGTRPSGQIVVNHPVAKALPVASVEVKEAPKKKAGKKPEENQESLFSLFSNEA